MELSQEDLKYIKEESRNNNVHKYFEHVASKKFKVGDVVIKKVRDGDLMSGNYKEWTDVPWKILKVSPMSPTNKKFLVVHVDECGVPYVKHIRVDGSLGGIACLGNMNTDCSVFEHDPEYVDHILLNGEDRPFDPLGSYKEGKS